MEIKYKILRMGESRDNGPEGEFGIIIKGSYAGIDVDFTAHCPTNHEHSKACAQTLLDSKWRGQIERWFTVRLAPEPPKPVHAQAALPTKMVDGELVNDTDLV